MTIEQRPAGGLFRLAVRVIAILCGLTFGWFASMAAVMLVSEVAPAALTIVPDKAVLAGLPDDVRMLRGGRHVLVLTSDRPGYVRQLYGAGAWLVLPALRNGCLDLKAVARRLKQQLE